MGEPNHETTAAAPALAGSMYQAAPITSLALARWSWSVAGLLLGALLGWVAASGTGYQGTAVLQLRSQGQGQGQGQADGTVALAALATSDGVLDLAVASLRPGGSFAGTYGKAGGRLPDALSNDETPAKDYLAAALRATPVPGSTDLVDVVVVREGAATQLPGLEANAIAFAVDQKIKNNVDDQIKALDTELAAQLKLVGPTSPDATTLRQTHADRIAQLALVEKHKVDVIPAKHTYAVGPDRMVSALLGAAGGAFLGALAAVGAGAGRRRPRSPRELTALAPDLVVRTTAQAGELAGRLLETGRRAIVVLALPKASFAAAQLALAVAHHVRTHGATVTVVDRLTDAAAQVAPDERLWALRRDVRLDVRGNFSADVLVVGCPADEEALSLIAGQSDLLVVVVARQRSTLLAVLRRTVDAVRVSEPVVVLSP